MTIQSAAALANADQEQTGTTDTLLDIRGLSVDYMTPRGPARAVDEVSLSVARGEALGLAGESGCGKSTIAHAIMRLIKPPGRISGGQIIFDGRDVLTMTPAQVRDFRWRQVAIVFQNAMSALNPVITIGEQITDAIRAHERVSKRQALERAADLLHVVGIDSRHLRGFAHELSGGMRQRAVIAMALALNPALIIMDEPTTALDVVVQRDILQQIDDLKDRFGFSIIFITHDLSLLVEFSTRIAVMYAGKIAETAPAAGLFHDPKHPYTAGLMNSFPSVSGEKNQLQGIPGAPPDLVAPPPGCRFAPRCPHVMAVCHTVEPALRTLTLTPAHRAACHLYEGEGESRHASAISRNV